MRGAKSAKWVVGAVIVALAATACGGDNKDDKSSAGAGKGGGTFSLGLVEPVSIDPVNAQESEGILVTDNLFTGLYEPTADGKVIPALATSKTVSDDGKTWTFKIKPGTKFTNGEVVNAEAFIRGWTRLAAKASASDVATPNVGGIDGFEALQKGTGTTFSGLSAPDENTLQVKLATPDFEFDVKTTHTSMSPVPKVAGAGKNQAYNDAPIGNGPFKMSGKWEHNKSITLVRNDDYGLAKAHLDKVNISILNSANASQLEYQGFQSGQFDWARMPTAQLTAAKAKYTAQGEWIQAETSGMNYLLPITDNGPLKTAKARQAISYAIDRDAIIAGVFQGMQTKSTTILPPSFADVYTKDLCVSCIKQDKEKAKSLAAEAGLKPGDELHFGFNTGGGHEEWVQAVAQQVKDVLGLNVKIDAKPFKELLAAQQAPGATGAYRFAWGADYPTPDNFLFPLLDSKSINPDASGKVQGDNRARYNSPAFDALVEKARSTKDTTARNEVYKQAEKLAMDDQALIPLWNRTQFRLVNTKKFANGAMDFHEDPNLAQITLK
ncbi:ABC transporter substrate-binding protein [Streptomyces sp. SID13666]|uniref:peptide ABC transporter substrate-binding protein n=1 Tax=Streptomyces TaxID=1883 RepID=UPI001105F5D0|nr:MULTISPECIES: ABC transporter substrate-binding protein [Streptomyces]MCZ4098177.1 ABC transporter substrate-binding protein [Streptomyces sp. H39-C1]NEA55295.1 ABC transporter substrate-binding protein [Streptomyces sp. SID13666]NEA73501.1 ABC transporter substrate-binding protein [Streptomyces sp. SID13588]QNA75106.1 ABC transporter substrate-binding protein [Streptomyces sp. So13.3]